MGQKSIFIYIQQLNFIFNIQDIKDPQVTCGLGKRLLLQKGRTYLQIVKRLHFEETHTENVATYKERVLGHETCKVNKRWSAARKCRQNQDLWLVVLDMFLHLVQMLDSSQCIAVGLSLCRRTPVHICTKLMFQLTYHNLNIISH